MCRLSLSLSLTRTACVQHELNGRSRTNAGFRTKIPLHNHEGLHDEWPQRLPPPSLLPACLPQALALFDQQQQKGNERGRLTTGKHTHTLHACVCESFLLAKAGQQQKSGESERKDKDYEKKRWKRARVSRSHAAPDTQQGTTKAKGRREHMYTRDSETQTQSLTCLDFVRACARGMHAHGNDNRKENRVRTENNSKRTRRSDDDEDDVVDISTTTTATTTKTTKKLERNEKVRDTGAAQNHTRHYNTTQHNNTATHNSLPVRTLHSSCFESRSWMYQPDDS